MIGPYTCFGCETKAVFRASDNNGVSVLGWTHPWSNVEINAFVWNKVLLQILYFGSRNRLIQLKRTIDMQQLLLSSPALGSCIPNLGCFQHIINQTKWIIWQKYFYRPIYHPLAHLASKSQLHNSNQRGVLIFQSAPVFGPAT